MKRFTVLTLFCLALYSSSDAQVYFTKNAKISFFSSAPLEDIKADNNQVISIMNMGTGEIQFSLLNNAFHFKKALMEEHFNDNYMESAKYPKSAFKGSISNISSVAVNSNGTYKVTVTGSLTIHGVTKTITVPGTITVRSGKISASSVFTIKPKDYNISIPSSVKDNISENIELTISCEYEKK